MASLQQTVDASKYLEFCWLGCVQIYQLWWYHGGLSALAALSFSFAKQKTLLLTLMSKFPLYRQEHPASGGSCRRYQISFGSKTGAIVGHIFSIIYKLIITMYNKRDRPLQLSTCYSEVNKLEQKWNRSKQFMLLGRGDSC